MRPVLKAFVFGICFLGCVSGSALAQSPNNPIKIIAPYTPGGIVDITSRILAKRLSVELGQPVIVENMPGANGQVGAERTVKSKPDGTTLMIIGNGIAYRQHIVKLPYDPLKDLEAISLLGTSPAVIVVNPDRVAARTVPEFLKLAKAQDISMGNSGAGGITHLIGELFRIKTGTKLTPIPYKGDSAAVIDAVGGSLDSTISSIPGTSEFIKAGKLHPVVVMSAKRDLALPNVPTAAESGIPGTVADIWVGLLGPAGIPPETLKRLSTALTATCKDDATRSSLEATGLTVICSSPDEFKRIMHHDAEMWRELIVNNKLAIE